MRPGRRAPSAAPTDPPAPTDPAGRDGGAAALEFALVAPLLFFLVFMVFGAGWGLWEYQAARATAREAARLASLGIANQTAYATSVVCLGEHNGMRPGSLIEIDLSFYRVIDGALTKLISTDQATVGDYVRAQLTYASSIHDLPIARWALTDADGHFRTVALTRVEQIPVSVPPGIATEQLIPVVDEVCA